MRRNICASRSFIYGVVGVGLGAVSGCFAGAVGFLIQTLVEVIWAFPALLLAIAIMAYLSQDLGNRILALVMQHRISYIAVSREVKHCRCANVNSSRRRARSVQVMRASSSGISCLSVSVGRRHRHFA
jgi:ABC-type microcin C transport system permease subunit YejE